MAVWMDQQSWSWKERIFKKAQFSNKERFYVSETTVANLRCLIRFYGDAAEVPKNSRKKMP